MSQSTYQAAYHTLKANAERLGQGEPVDIDTLMTLVEESIVAYKVCQARIDAVEKALANAFDDDAVL